MLEFILFTPRYSFRVFGMESRNHLSFITSNSAQFVKICFMVLVSDWHSLHGGTGCPSIRHPWFISVEPVHSLLITVSSILYVIFFCYLVLGVIFFKFVSFSSPPIVKFQMYSIV